MTESLREFFRCRSADEPREIFTAISVAYTFPERNFCLFLSYRIANNTTRKRRWASLHAGKSCQHWNCALTDVCNDRAFFRFEYRLTNVVHSYIMYGIRINAYSPGSGYSLYTSWLYTLVQNPPFMHMTVISAIVDLIATIFGALHAE